MDSGLNHQTNKTSPVFRNVPALAPTFDFLPGGNECNLPRRQTPQNRPNPRLYVKSSIRLARTICQMGDGLVKDITSTEYQGEVPMNAYLFYPLLGFVWTAIGLLIMGMIIKTGYLPMILKDSEDYTTRFIYGILWPLMIYGLVLYFTVEWPITQCCKLSTKQIQRILSSPFRLMSWYVRWTLSGFSIKE